MIGPTSLRWLLTVAFAGACGFHVLRVLAHRGASSAEGEHRLSHVLHLVMGVGMVVMIWPWGSWVPMPVWVVIFSLSTAWFLARTVWSARRAAPAFFATAMAAMVWMGAATPAQAMPGASPGGMDMPGMEPAVAWPVGWISALLGVYLMLAALCWLIVGMRIRGLPAVTAGELGPPNWSAVCHAVMSAGMGIALLAMM